MQLTTKCCAKVLASVAAFAGVFALAGHADAAPETHDGFYLQIDAGLGYLSSSAEAGPFKITLSGVTLPVSFLMGGTVGPVVIGGGFFADHAASPGATINGQSAAVSGDVTMTLVALGIFADIYPDPHKGLHFQPFVGWGGLETSRNGDSGGSDPTGLVLAIGGGYDVFVSDNWSIGGMARLAYAPLKLDSTTYSTIAPALLATFTYH